MSKKEIVVLLLFSLCLKAWESTHAPAHKKEEKQIVHDDNTPKCMICRSPNDLSLRFRPDNEPENAPKLFVCEQCYKKKGQCFKCNKFVHTTGFTTFSNEGKIMMIICDNCKPLCDHCKKHIFNLSNKKPAVSVKENDRMKLYCYACSILKKLGEKDDEDDNEKRDNNTTSCTALLSWLAERIFCSSIKSS